MAIGFKEHLQQVNPEFTCFKHLQTLQLNFGNLCNLSCSHCHVNASPSSEKIMQKEVMSHALDFLRRNSALTIDITGGCPELNPNFRWFMEESTNLAQRRMLRSNLTICAEPGMDWLPEFYREQKLVIIASLPCYLEENVDRQRGKGVHATSIQVLRTLNSLGYGDELELNLVYNPGGAYIPGSQKELEQAYRVELAQRYSIRFSNLYTITNAPIGRFRNYLEKIGKYGDYLNLLSSSFNPAAAGNIMCRTLVSVDWRGILYNCDFNQAKGLPIPDPSGGPLTISRMQDAVVEGKELLLGEHCYCCTAGEGSSCTGALAA